MYNGQLVNLIYAGSIIKARIICIGERKKHNGPCKKHNGPLIQVLSRPLPTRLPGERFDLHKGNDTCKRVNTETWPKKDLYYIYGAGGCKIETPELDRILGL